LAVITARELRDMVYSDLTKSVQSIIITSPDKSHQHSYVRLLRSGPNSSSYSRDLGSFTSSSDDSDSSEDSDDSDHTDDGENPSPTNVRHYHYLTEDFTGTRFAVQIVQVLHKSVKYTIGHVRDVVPFLSSGKPLTAHPSCQPLNFIRYISVNISMKRYGNFERGSLSRRTLERQQKCNEKTANKAEYNKQLRWLADIAQTKQVSQTIVQLHFQTFTISAAQKYRISFLPYFYELKTKGCNFSTYFRVHRRLERKNHYNQNESLSEAQERHGAFDAVEEDTDDSDSDGSDQDEDV
jgi:hypothetical protein